MNRHEAAIYATITLVSLVATCPTQRTSDIGWQGIVGLCLVILVLNGIRQTKTTP
jgi:hypothetical protein